MILKNLLSKVKTVIKLQSGKNVITFLITSIINFISFTIFIKSFGFKLYGEYSLILSFIFFSSTFDFSNNFSLIKYNSGFDSEQKNAIVRFIIKFNLILSSISILFFYLTVTLFSDTFFSKEIYNEFNVNQSLLLICLSIIFIKYVYQFLKSLAESEEMYTVNNNSMVIQSVLLFSFSVVVFFRAQHNILDLFLIQLFSIICASIYILIKVKKYIFTIVDLNGRKKIPIRKIIGYNASLQISFIVGSFQDSLIKILINKIYGSSLVTSFEIAKKITDIMSGIINSIFRQYTVKIGQFFNNGINDFKVQIYKPALNEIIIFNEVFLIQGSILTIPLIFLWFHDVPSVLFYVLLVCFHYMNNISIPTYTVYMITGKSYEIIGFQLLNLIFIGLFSGIIYQLKLHVSLLVLSQIASSLFIFWYSIKFIHGMIPEMNAEQIINLINYKKFIMIPILILIASLLFIIAENIIIIIPLIILISIISYFNLKKTSFIETK